MKIKVCIFSFYTKVLFILFLKILTNNIWIKRNYNVCYAFKITPQSWNKGWCRGDLAGPCRCPHHESAITGHAACLVYSPAF